MGLTPTGPIAMQYALIDCNAYYCSAEILFRPWLRTQPVVVASSNDGCVVSRNDHAKALGIKMGAPVFELRDLMQRGELHVFSSNYELYQSISNRVMAVIAELSPRQFINSVDESFADLSGIADTHAWGVMARDTIQQRLGIPVGVGIAPTLTLAKLANWAAKRWKAKTGCVVEMLDPDRREKLLRYAPVGEVWGIGSRISRRLGEELRIENAWQLATADPKVLRRVFSVNVEKTARELMGVACFPFGTSGPERKQMITTSRSFGSRVTTLEGLQGAVAAFVATATGKLRGQGSMACCLQVFAQSSPFSSAVPYSRNIVVQLPFPSSDSRVITGAAMAAVSAIYRAGVEFSKAGITLSQFCDAQGWTGDMFAPAPKPGSEAVMKVMDAINAKQGRGALRLAREAGGTAWKMNRNHLSPAYTTAWSGLPRAHAK